MCYILLFYFCRGSKSSGWKGLLPNIFIVNNDIILQIIWVFCQYCAKTTLRYNNFFANDLDHPDVLFDAKRTVQYDCFCKWPDHPDGLAFSRRFWSKICILINTLTLIIPSFFHCTQKAGQVLMERKSPREHSHNNLLGSEALWAPAQNDPSPKHTQIFNPWKIYQHFSLLFSPDVWAFF